MDDTVVIVQRMQPNDSFVHDLFRGRRVVRVPRDSPAYFRVHRLAASGTLVRVLPGIFARAGDDHLGPVRAQALQVYDPAAVLTGRAAAALHLARDVWPDLITFTSPRQWTLKRPWLLGSRGRLPQDHVWPHPIPHTEPALTALMMATTRGPDVVDDTLRMGLATPESLQWAVTAMARTPGNATRRLVAAGATDNPWSSTERELHALLRRARLAGWEGNLKVRAQGSVYFIDVAFRNEMVAVEVDGWSYHSDSLAFEKDRHRRNALALAGWLVIQVTPTMLRDSPDGVLSLIRAALGQRRAA